MHERIFHYDVSVLTIVMHIGIFEYSHLDINSLSLLPQHSLSFIQYFFYENCYSSAVNGYYIVCK